MPLKELFEKDWQELESDIASGWLGIVEPTGEFA